MKKILLIIFIIIATASSFIVIKRLKQRTKKAAYTIGILQTASHPALDASRDGFMEELKNKLGTTVEFVIHNAQSSVTQAHALAQQFHANRSFNGFFAIATPAAQAMSSVEKERPIIIAAVTDPQALGLIHPTTNVCGIKDMINIKAEIEILTQLVPQAKKVGLIYTSGETNSIAQIKQMRLELEARGLTPYDFALSNEADMQTIAELACRKTDVILTPTDNTVASTITVLTTITRKYKKPFIVSDNMLVAYGALAARGIDYMASGKQAAQIAYEVFVNGKKPYELPIKQAESQQIVINESTLKMLELSIPESLKNHIVFVS